VHFMDIASSELNKASSDISVPRLQSLLDLCTHPFLPLAFLLPRRDNVVCDHPPAHVLDLPPGDPRACGRAHTPSLDMPVLLGTPSFSTDSRVSPHPPAALRMSVASNDDHVDDLASGLEKSTIINQLLTIFTGMCQGSPPRGRCDQARGARASPG
jgi:hypothetical protein